MRHARHPGQPACRRRTGPPSARPPSITIPSCLLQVRPADVDSSARSHGHSTPQIAGRLARRVEAKHLVLTHFSTKFLDDRSAFSQSTMGEIRDQACREFGSRNVTLARDLLTLRVNIDGSLDDSVTKVTQAGRRREQMEQRTDTGMIDGGPGGGYGGGGRHRRRGRP